MRIFCLTSDHYIKAVRPFSWLFNKYWSEEQQVTVAGFKAPDFDLPSNFSFHSLGDMSDYPVDKWSDALIKLLADFPHDDTFVLFLEDYWLTRPVNVDAVQKLHDYMLQFRNVLKMDLCADRLYAAGASDYNHCGYLDLIRSDPASQYHMSLYLGMWNRELLLRFLKRGETPWQVELDGTPRVARAAADVLVLGTRQSPCRITLAHRRGNPQELLLDGLDAVDVATLRLMGYIE